MVFSFGFDKSFMTSLNNVSPRFWMLLHCCFAQFFYIFYDTWKHTNCIFYWSIDNIFSLSLLLSASSISFFPVVVIIISASIHKITQQMFELLYFPPMFIDHVMCVMCCCEVRREMPDYNFHYPAKKKMFILRQNDAQKKNLHQKRSF